MIMVMFVSVVVVLLTMISALKGRTLWCQMTSCTILKYEPTNLQHEDIDTCQPTMMAYNVSGYTTVLLSNVETRQRSRNVSSSSLPVLAHPGYCSLTTCVCIDGLMWDTNTLMSQCLSALLVWGQLGVSGSYEPGWQCDRDKVSSSTSSIRLSVCGCSRPLHTWECPVSSVDPSLQPTAASPLSLLDDCSSGPALSDGRGWSSELRPEKHSLPLWSDSLTGCKHTKQHTWSHHLRLLLSVKHKKKEIIFVFTHQIVKHRVQLRLMGTSVVLQVFGRELKYWTH